MELVVRPELINAGGLLSGVAGYALVDYSMGSALWAHITEAESIVTASISVNYLATATEGASSAWGAAPGTALRMRNSPWSVVRGGTIAAARNLARPGVERSERRREPLQISWCRVRDDVEVACGATVAVDLHGDATDDRVADSVTGERLEQRHDVEPPLRQGVAQGPSAAAPPRARDAS